MAELIILYQAASTIAPVPTATGLMLPLALDRASSKARRAAAGEGVGGARRDGLAKSGDGACACAGAGDASGGGGGDDDDAAAAASALTSAAAPAASVFQRNP